MSAPSPRVARAVPCAYCHGTPPHPHGCWQCCNRGTRWDVTNEPAVSIPDLIAWLDEYRATGPDEHAQGWNDALEFAREHMEGLR